MPAKANKGVSGKNLSASATILILPISTALSGVALPTTFISVKLSLGDVTSLLTSIASVNVTSAPLFGTILSSSFIVFIMFISSSITIVSSKLISSTILAIFTFPSMSS